MSNGSSIGERRSWASLAARIRAFADSRTVGFARYLPIAAAITLLAWPIAYRPITTGLDPSWREALHLAVSDGLRFGTDFVFTYGPLGFLSLPSPPVGWTSVLALIASGLVYLALVLLMLHGLRRLLPLWAAAIVALVAARVFANLPPYEALQVVVFILGAEVLLGIVRLPAAVIVVGGGLLAAVAILGKLNVGVFVALMVGVVATSFVRPWPKGILAYLAALSVSLLGLWLLSGQHLADIPPFIRGSIEIVSGYSQAMGTDREPPRYHWIYLGYAVVAVTLLWYAFRATIDDPRARRFGVLALLAILLFAMWKTAFVRANPAYMFATLGLAAIPFLWSVSRQTAFATLAAIWIGYLAAAPPQTTSPVGYFDVSSSVRSALLLGRAALPWRLEREADLTRARLRAQYQLPADVLAAIGNQGVHIDPWEAGIAEAYPALRWDPLPVFQAYSAYTAALDELDADRLRSDARPPRVLREFSPRTFTSDPSPPTAKSLAPAIDGRMYWFDSPAATLERLCRYQQLVVDAQWQVLGATGRQCGPPIALGTVEAPAGRPVSVPAAPTADQFVIVRVHGVGDGLIERIRTALWKATEWYVKVEDRTYRLVPGTAEQGLLLAVPPAAQGSPPFAFGPAIQSITIGSGTGGGASKAKLTYEFLAVPMAPLGSETPASGPGDAPAAIRAP
jgi:hypothetical protein